MATVYWIGGADAVAQVSTGSIDSVDGTPANNTFTVTIGGIAVSAVGDTDVATTAGNLVTSLNASTHPYFAAVTWTNPSAGNITGTADTAGAPFTAALTVSGAGSGSVTDFSDDTASAGPNDWSTADNWSGGAVPSSSDNVYLRQSAVPIAWGLGQSAVDLTLLVVEQSYTGRIGLRPDQFATSADGLTTDSSAPEYRDLYLDIGADDIRIGEHFGPGAPAGAAMLNIDNDKAGASQLVVFDTATAGVSTLAAVNYLAAHASADVEVRAAPGGISIAGLVPGETATVGDVDVVDSTSAARVYVTGGVTLTNYSQRGGQNVLAAAATITLMTVDGGELDVINGDYAITTMTVNGGTVRDQHENSSAVTGTLNLNGGEVDYTGSQIARTVTTVNHEGGVLKRGTGLTVTTYNEPTGLNSITVADL